MTTAETSNVFMVAILSRRILDERFLLCRFDRHLVGRDDSRRVRWAAREEQTESAGPVSRRSARALGRTRKCCARQGPAGPPACLPRPRRAVSYTHLRA